MATYGTRDANRWKPGSTVGPNIGGDLGDTQFYPIVNATTGEIQIKRLTTSSGSGGLLDTLEIQSGSLDQTVATKLPNEDWVITDKATSAEKSWFSDANNQKAALNQAKITSIKAQQNLGVTPEQSRQRTNQLLTGQTPTPPGDNEAPSQPLQNKVDRPKTKNKSGDFGDPMSYPENMKSGQDKIKIDMIKFNPRKLDFTGGGFSDRVSPTTKDIIGTVTLAIPGGIRDSNEVKWGSQDMNAAQAKIASVANKFIQKGQLPPAVDMANELSAIANDPLLKQAIALGFAGAAVGAQGLLARTQGAILNPNTELLFSGPALRAFTFQFPFSPRTETEAKKVQRIIRFFKQGMAVQRTQRSLFLKAPNVFQLKYLNGNAEHKFLPKIKICALLNCSVDYTPDGNYTTYQDGSMTNYTMSLTFNELDPIFNDEYTGDEEGTTTDNIGY